VLLVGGKGHGDTLPMIIFKILATFLLLWLAAEIVGLIFNSKSPRGFLTSATALCVALVTYYLWLA
jgi:hypothetical protein